MSDIGWLAYKATLLPRFCMLAVMPWGSLLDLKNRFWFEKRFLISS